MFNSVRAMTNPCNILGLWSQQEALSLSLCTAERNKCDIVFFLMGCRSAPRDRKMCRDRFKMLFCSPVNQFPNTEAAHRHTETLIHRMLLTYLASAPGSFGVFRWQHESQWERRAVSRRIAASPSVLTQVNSGISDFRRPLSTHVSWTLRMFYIHRENVSVIFDTKVAKWSQTWEKPPPPHTHSSLLCCYKPFTNMSTIAPPAACMCANARVRVCV